VNDFTLGIYPKFNPYGVGVPHHHGTTGFTRGYSHLTPMGLFQFESKIIFNQKGNRMLFNVILEEAEDGWIVAECPALPGCVSQGKNRQEALENIKEAITAWLWAENQKAFYL